MAHFGKDLDNFSASRTVQIIGSETNEQFTTYTIEVTVGSYTWTVKHRYSEFHELHEKLIMGYKLDKSLLPPKKLFGNQTEGFIKKRQQDLQVYLQTVLHYLAHHPPPCLTFFLNFHLYEIHGITQAMAEDLYNRGEVILQSKEVYQVTPLQLYSLTERLKLPEPTCDSGDVKKDLGHILDFITRAKHLQISGSSDPVGTSNINMNQLKFDLSLFKSLQSLEVIMCNFQMVQGLETIKQTLSVFNVYRTANSIREVVLQDVPRWKGEDGTQLVGGWDHVARADFSHNFITEIDDSVPILWRVEQLNLSHNQLEGVQHLQWLSQMTHLDLSHNRLRVLDSLHTKLGNLKCLLLSENCIESLQGFSKLFSLEVLDVSDNKISNVEDVRPVCRLPCLEKLQLMGNAVALTIDYRTKILEMFGDRVDEVSLDNQKATQKEKDTVAVRQALLKAREAKPRLSGPRKNSSTSLSEVYGGRGGATPTPPPTSTCESLPSGGGAVCGSSALVQQQRRGSSQISSSAPQCPFSSHPWSFPDLQQTRNRSPGGIFIPGQHSPSQISVSSCTSAQELLVEGNEVPSPIPEAHPFDTSCEARPAVPVRRMEYSATDLPTMTSLDFVSWLEDRLLSEDTPTPAPHHAPTFSSPHPGNAAITTATTPAAAGATSDQVMDVMWCYAQQYSNPGAIFPCCAVLTSTKVIVERLSGLAEESTFPGIPELRPCVILPLRSIQHVVIGPCHAYLRLEEAFVGKGGLFTLFAVETPVLKHFSETLNECCTQLDESSPLDALDLSHRSDLLTEICRREEVCGLPSDRLAFVQLVRMKDHRGGGEGARGKTSLLVLSENNVYCLDPACVYWPPATFESAHEGSIHLKVLREFSIMEDIVDVTLHAAADDSRSPGGHHHHHQQGQTEFTLTPLTMRVKMPAPSSSPSSSSSSAAGERESGQQRELTLLFGACNSRDAFLDRLTNLRAEHAHRMSPSIRQAPEGGNESQETGDSGSGGIGGVGGYPSQHTQKDLGPAVVLDGDAGRKSSRPSPPKLTVTSSHSGSSLPSSFDWKGYYFNNASLNTSHSASDFAGMYSDDKVIGKTAEVEDGDNKEEEENDSRAYLSDIQSSGEVEEAAPTPFELELREEVRSYDLLPPLPAQLRPVTLMSGREVAAFFYSKIAGTPSSLASSPGELSAARLAAPGPEELRHVMWTIVVPYTDPGKEVVTLVMLSTRAVYLVSDSTAAAPPTARPSWMTHTRHKSDSEVSWHSKTPAPRAASGRGGYWNKVKPYAVVALTDLLQVSMGMFDQFLRLTGPDAHTVYTLATRDSKVTSGWVERLKATLSLMVPSSPSPRADKTHLDVEQDFYHAFARRTNSTVEGLVYTHPSQVTFLYPGDDAVDDILFLIKAKIQAGIPAPQPSAQVGSPASVSSVSSSSSSTFQNRAAMWLYILAYQILPPFLDNAGAGGRGRGGGGSTIPLERVQQRSVVVTSGHLCLLREDTVTYPLPDFVRGLPERPQHEVTETRRLESLKRILLSPSDPHVLTLVFWDEPEELVVDTSMQHFGGAGGRGKGGGGREVLPDILIRLYVQSQRDRDKLVQTLQKQWRELVLQVGRILDVVRE